MSESGRLEGSLAVGGGHPPPTPLPLAGLVHRGDRDIPWGGVGRSAHQMTSHPSIDLFIVVPVALLTQGNWALPCAHVLVFAVIWGWWLEGWGEEGHGD